MRLTSINPVQIAVRSITLSCLTGFLAFTVCPISIAQPRPRPEHDGKIIRQDSTGRLFWIDQGVRRWIDANSQKIYSRLFNSVNPTVIIAAEEIMPLGSLVTDKNRLVRCSENGNPLSGRVYFLDQDQKRWVSSPNMMKKYNFNWNGIESVSCPVIGALKDGPTFK